jgi:hypothetical protein
VQVCFYCSAALALSCWCRLSSNVRRLTFTMSAFVAPGPAVPVLKLGHGIGAIFKVTRRRRFVRRQKTEPVSALRPTVLAGRLAPSPASSCSAERDAAVAPDRKSFEGVSSWCSRRARPCPAFTPCNRRLEDQDGQPRWRLRLRSAFGQKNTPKCHSVLGGVVVIQAPHPASRSPKTPNPSFKPSPNSKMPGPRRSPYHHLQRGPGIFLSVPA